MIPFILLLLGWTSPSYAGVSDVVGNWAGPGTVMDETSQLSDCGTVEVEIVAKDDRVEFPSGLNNCQIISSLIEAFTLEIRGGKELWLNDRKVGGLEDGKITVQHRNEELGFDELLELEPGDGVLYYRDTVTLIGEESFLTIKAKLSRR